MSDIPQPWLEYHTWGRYDFDPNVITDDSVSLDAVHTISVMRDPDGGMQAYLRGPMRKRDGQRGRHHRSVRVVPHPAQPAWLTRLFADASLRLPVREAAS